ncbi:MAG: hypothetical protein C3F02_00275 [Parcubacteria group bacterium]|nr:MAG: hypothetical protein C3F02_00275 [Parcubacteria group bacterium]
MTRSRINNYLAKIPLFFNLHNLVYKPLDLIYKPADLNWNYYHKIKEVEVELEHQIGRLTNFKEIIESIDRDKLPGDVVEFGCWKGFSVLWLAYLLERTGIFDKNIIGLDSFAGLPEADGVFKKVQFSDASLKDCRRSIYYSRDLYSPTKKKVVFYKNNFSETKDIVTKLKSRKFCLVHIDCDIASSAQEIFKILLEGDLMAERCYVVFDDYGCQSGLKEAVDNIISGLSDRWEITPAVKTKLTKNYFFNRKR